MTRVFIDGESGTTGLKIYEKLSRRSDIDIIGIDREKRRDPAAKTEAIGKSDIVILCLPDDAAREDAIIASSLGKRVIDTSTAHRTEPGWIYGMPELYDDSSVIQDAMFLANPGCHASGYILLTAPLVKAGILSPDACLSLTSVTGYSGGGKKMISDYQNNISDEMHSPGLYALGQTHKHLPEMVKYSGVKSEPIFCPLVCDFFSGMLSVVSLFKKDISGGIRDIEKVYFEKYRSEIVFFEKSSEDIKTIYSSAMSGKDSMKISVYGNDERITLVAEYDNLGKGASGSAVQCLNLMAGYKETEGLEL